MKLYYIFLILLIAFNSCSERESFLLNSIDPNLGGNYKSISGNVSGYLLQSDSPFLVTNDLVVDAGKVLIIEPGVELFFKNEVQLKVHGRLDAIGTASAIIRFTAFDSDWAGIHFISTNDNSTLQFCKFEFIYLPQESPLENGAIEIMNGAASIINCIFQYNYSQYGGGIAAINSNVLLKNSTFYRNEAIIYGGAVFVQNSTMQIINNTFYRNFSVNYGGGVVIDEPINVELQNNIFFNNFSYLGDPRIEFVNGDSSNVFEQFNFLAFGEMNPQFLSETNYRLQQNSPCINNGNPDPQFNDANGSRNDQGAYGGPDGDW